MADFKNYDPQQVIVVFKGIPIKGFAKGQFIKVSRDSDTFSTEEGAQGDIVRIRKRSKKATATITLLASSSSNDDLSRTALVDEKTGLGYGSFMMKNLNGNTLVSGPNSWIRKIPEVSFGDEHQNVEWVIDIAELEIFVGGFIV